MSIGILGKKVGMTRVYDDAGAAVAVTVIEAEPNAVTKINENNGNGKRSVQVAFDETTEKRTTRPMNGHFKKAGTAPYKFLKEFPLEEGAELAVGSQLDVSQFQEGQFVDVIGLSKGRGFQGGVHRHGFAGQPDSHGSKNAPAHRFRRCRFHARSGLEEYQDARPHGGSPGYGTEFESHASAHR
jgi:large subunit ribosomal protein L3